MSDPTRPPPEGADAAPILTVPAELDEVAAVVPVANTWVAVPDLDAADGAIASVTVLHDAAGGLLELRGAPLSAIDVVIDGENVGPAAWGRGSSAELPPTWHASVGGCELTLTVACPPDHRGVVQALTVTNHGTGDVEVEVICSGRLATASLHVFSARPVDGPHRWRFDPWTRALVAEVSTGLPVVALAVRADDGAVPELSPPGTPGLTGRGLGPTWTHRRTHHLAAGSSATQTLYLGVGREADGAALTTVDLARHGAQALLRRTAAWREARCGPTLVGRSQLQGVRDRNRLFCLTFAAGRTIDTDELVLVTSRSPRYYVSGAHWTRDSLLWAFPAVLTVDLPLAAAWLRAAFVRYARTPGVHALYLDGGVLYPGFELDEVAAFLLALDRYLAVADATLGELGGEVEPADVAAGVVPSEALLGDPTVLAGLARVDAALDGARDAATGLYATFLMSSDDPAPRPFATYSNALTVAALRARARIRRRLGDGHGAERAEQAADALWETLLRHGIVDGPFGPMFCGATDGHGDAVLFDEPPGSLELLADLGVIAPDDPRFVATVAWINSAHNPDGPGDGRYATPSCPHARHPWLLAVGNALLRGETRWLDLLPELPLDTGFACETFDAVTGEPRTGVGFATCAGWLAHAIDVAAGVAPGRGSDER